MRTHYRFQSAVLLLPVCLLLLFASCTPQDDDLGEDQPVVFENLGNIISGDANIISFSWATTQNHGGTTLQLRLYNESGNPGLIGGGAKSELFNTPGSGVGSFYWDGRKSINYQYPYGGKYIPLAPGYYEIDLHSGESFKSKIREITVVANNFDTDGDGISNAVEDENGGVTGAQTQIIDQNGSFHYNWYVSNSSASPPLLPSSLSSSNFLYRNRNTHDYSIASGTTTSGVLISGIRIANSGIGYQYYPSMDPLDTDNFGTLELINLVELIGREWSRLHPDYPIISSGDMSKEGGGQFPPHSWHRNGLDVDMRYIRTDASSGPVTVNDASYSRQRSQELINLFRSLGRINIIYAGDDQLQGTTYDATGEHNNHFHVRITDPDGYDN